MRIVLPVPVSSARALGIRELFEESFGRVAFGVRTSLALPAIITNLIHTDLPQPGAERPLALPLKPGDLTRDHHEDLLRHVVDVVAEARNTAQPLTDERLIDLLRSVPVGVVRPGGPQAVEQADGGRFHLGPPVRAAEVSKQRSYLSKPLARHHFHRHVSWSFL